MVDDSGLSLPSDDGFGDVDGDKNIFEQWPEFNKKEEEENNEFKPGEWKEIAVPNQTAPVNNKVLPPVMSTSSPASNPRPSVPVITPPAINPIQPRVARTPVQPINVGGPTNAELAAVRAAKRRQPMLLLGGGGGSGSGSGRVNKELQELLNSDFQMKITGVDKARANLIGNTDNMIAQGKVIDAVLETAINTDIEGMLRAVVSRDVYAESGRNILVPKGSRLIGSYSKPEENSSRVIIEWTRVIRPDGIDVMIDSPGTDKMGRAGMAGFIDNKYFDIIKNAILLSTLSIGSSILVDDIRESQQQTSTATTNADGSTTTSNSGTTTDAAVLSSVSDLSDIADNIAEGLLNDRPTVIIQQGTKLKVFVNRDLHFPKSIASNIKFVN